MHKTQDRQRTKITTKADDNTGKMQIIWLMTTMLPKRRENASQRQKQERKKKKDFQRKGDWVQRSSCYISLRPPGDSNSEPATGLNNTTNKNSHGDMLGNGLRHIHWSLKRKPIYTSASNLLQISRLLEKTHNWPFGILEIIATNWYYEYVHKLTYTLNVVQIRTF